MYYIFTSEQEAIDYQTESTSQEKYNGQTQNYSDVFKHPSKNQWAVLVHPLVIIEGKATQENLNEWS